MAKRKTHEEFTNEMIAINPDIKILGKYRNANTKILCKCKLDGYEWQARPRHLLRGHGCPECAGNRRKTHDEFVRELHAINTNVEVLGKYKTNNEKIKCKCLIDGNEWETQPSVLLMGCGCPKCNASKGEKSIADYLEVNRIPYKPQHSFKGCEYKQSLLFDFYLPTLNTAIEYDGQQHFEPVEIFGGEESFKKQQVKDNIKNSYCKKKNINLIRIPYTVESVVIYLEEQLANMVKD